MKRVLIITYSFPPLNNIAARRFGELIPYLEGFGWEVTVITTHSQGNLELEDFNGKLYRYAHHPQKNQVIYKNSQNNFKEKVMSVKRNMGFNSRLLDRTYFTWFKKIKKEHNLKEKEFDVIIASFGPGTALLLGHYLSKKLNIPWIADFRDLGAIYEDKYFKQNILFKFMDKKIEKYLIKNSEAITSVSETLARILEETYDKPAFSIFNGWKKNSKIMETPKESNYLYYAGRFYPHQTESIYLLLKALPNFPSLTLKIRSLGPAEMEEKIIHLAKQLKIESQVELLPPVKQSIVTQESQESRANIVFEDLNEKILWKKGTLTGKFLSMLPLAPPVLAIARKDSEIGYILKETNKGKLCSTDAEILDFLNKAQENYFNGNKFISNYSKKKQAEKLAELLNEYKS